MKWTPEQIAYLREHYANRKNSELAEVFGCSTHAVANKGFSLKLKKSREFIKATSCQFKKGMTPHNKGKPMPEATKAKIRTMYKKGNKPRNSKPVGSERVDKDGYLMVKVADGRREWKPKHHIGLDVPKGHKVIFIDGNKRNFEPSNLRVVSNAEMMKMNTMLRFPLELQNTLRAIKKLQRTIKNA